MILRARDLTVRYRQGREPAVRGVDLDLGAGELVAVAGPNGSGKTTLLKALLGGVALERGTVEIDGRPLDSWGARELARTVGVVTQREDQLFPLRVREMVMLGRYAELGAFAAERERDRAVVREAMERADVARFADRRTDTLSGGEWQRVRIARALAQQPRLLVLDEPTAGLDVRHEMEVYELVRALTVQGISALLVTHHLNLAARYADRMLLLHEGRTAGIGPPAAVLTPDAVARVFDWRIAITTWCDGAPQLVPLKPQE